MAETKSQIQAFVDQWATYLCARMYLATGLTIEQLTPRIREISLKASDPFLKNCYSTGLDIIKEFDETAILIFNKALETTIKEFATNPLFPRIFRVMMAYSHNIITLPIVSQAEQKPKALHSDAIINQENLQPIDLLSAEVLLYLSQVLQVAASTTSIKLDDIDFTIIDILWVFMNHNQANTVRASAGDIMSALSTSPKLCLEISDQFWKKFAKCKKDDDFRNFASLIDAVEKLHFSLMTPELADCSMHFFRAFVVSAKKIERGVLRMKFLDALYGIISRLSKEAPAATHAEYNKCLGEIWAIVLKWSSKGKHTAFCYKFLAKVLAASSVDFFVDHAIQFCELLTKYARNGDPDMLKLISEYISSTPVGFYRNRSEDFARLMNSYVLQLLFPGFEKKPSLKFDDPSKQPLITNIVIEIGKKQVGIIAELFKSVFQIPKPNADLLIARLTILQAVASICQSSPEIIRPFNDDFYPLIEPILLSSCITGPEELNVAMRTFPLIRSPNPTKLAQISQVLFDAAMSGNHSEATHALCRFVETLVSLSENPLPPVIYFGKLLDRLPLLPKPDIMFRLRFIKELAHAFSIAMSACSDEYESVVNNKSPLTAGDWSSLRYKVDKVLVPLLLSPDQDIVNAVNEVEIEFESLSDFDKVVIPAPAFFISRLVNEKGDLISKIPKIFENSSGLAVSLFESTFEYWTSNISRLDEKLSSRLETFLASIMRIDSPTTTKFFTEFYKLFANHDQATVHALNVIDPTMWASFITELNHWMTPAGHSLQSFWSEYVQVHFTFASSPKFAGELHSQEKLQDTYERFLITFWRSRDRPTDHTATERCFKVLQSYVQVCGVSKIIEDSSEFIQSMENYGDSFEKDVQVETFLRAMQSVCQNLTIPDCNFFQWLRELLIKFKGKNQVFIQSTQLLTIILTKQPTLLASYLKQSLKAPGPFVLAIANAYANGHINEENNAHYLMATVFAHLFSEEHEARQGAIKLMCLLLTNSLQVFTKVVDTSLMTALSSKTPFGYLEQGSHFAEFAASALRPNIALKMFGTFAKEIDCKLSCLGALVGFIEPAMSASDVTDFAMMIVHILSHCDPSNPADSRNILENYSAFWRSVKKQKPETAQELLQAIFNHAVESSDKNEIISSIFAMASAVSEFAKQTVTTLMAPVMHYERKLPTDLTSVVSFLESADLTFSVNKSEVIAYNGLSQVLQVLCSREEFDEQFSDSLSVLVFFAVMNHHVDDYHIGTFQPLLDVLLEAVLFRFGLVKPGGLERLKGANLLRRAPSLEPETRVEMEAPHAFLTYDTNAIRALVEELEGVKEGFKIEFFDELLAVCLQTDCSSERVSDPLTMLAGLADQMETRHVYFLLLYSIHAFKKNRPDALDALIDSIHARMMHGVLKRETLPVMIVFILYLSLEQKASSHIMKLVAEMCEKVTADQNESYEIAQGLIDFFSKFNGDQYITSLFFKYIVNAQSANDQIVLVAVRCLRSIAKLMAIASGSQYNMCMLLALLADGMRTFIGERTGVAMAAQCEEVVDIASFAKLLIEKFPQNQAFVWQFLSAVMKQVKWNDWCREMVALQIMRELVKEGIDLEGEELNKVVKAVSLLSLSSEEPGRSSGLETVSEIMLRKEVAKESYLLASMRPVFIDAASTTIGKFTKTTKMVVDPALMPEFAFFPFSGMETKDLVELLWNLISSKIEAEIH